MVHGPWFQDFKVYGVSVMYEVMFIILCFSHFSTTDGSSTNAVNLRYVSVKFQSSVSRSCQNSIQHRRNCYCMWFLPLWMSHFRSYLSLSLYTFRRFNIYDFLTILFQYVFSLGCTCDCFVVYHYRWPFWFPSVDDVPSMVVTLFT